MRPGGTPVTFLVLFSLGGRALGEPEPAAERAWTDGDHLTGEWDGARSALAERGIAINVAYTGEVFTARGEHAVVSHADAALTLDSRKLGLWDGGTLHVLVQQSAGHGINNTVDSAQPITNLEAAPYTELSELFLEQTVLDDRLRVRIGKQDASRDFGSRFGGDFLNRSFGMYPTAPLPSSPTTGIGAIVAIRPLAWLTGKLAIYEGNPVTGGFGLITAFRDPGSGYTVVGGAAITHTLDAAVRDAGTTSAGVWRQSGEFPELDAPAGAEPRRLGSDAGGFVQHDQRIYLHPSDPADPRGLTASLRASWARSDRTAIARYAGGSVAWRGIGPRHGDTAGIGAGHLRITQPLGGSPGPGAEWFVEAFYKLRLTNFIILQPDIQAFRHPGGDGRDARVAGLRLMLQL